MKVKVHMLAFKERGTIREVEIPDPKKSDAINAILEDVFRYGQNDFQPQNLPSVSAGDVIEYNGNFYDIKMVGFKQITPEEFKNLKGNRGWEIENYNEGE